MKRKIHIPLQGALQGRSAEIELQDAMTIQEYGQFIRWAQAPSTPAEQAPFRHLAAQWYQGLITLDEGKFLEGSLCIEAFLQQGGAQSE